MWYPLIPAGWTIARLHWEVRTQGQQPSSWERSSVLLKDFSAGWVLDCYHRALKLSSYHSSKYWQRQNSSFSFGFIRYHEKYFSRFSSRDFFAYLGFDVHSLFLERRAAVEYFKGTFYVKFTSHREYLLSLLKQMHDVSCSFVTFEKITQVISQHVLQSSGRAV